MTAPFQPNTRRVPCFVLPSFLLPLLPAQLLVLLKAGGRHIRSVDAWKAICALIVHASLHPAASAAAFDALGVVASRDALSTVSFRPCLDASVAIIERHSKVRIESP